MAIERSEAQYPAKWKRSFFHRNFLKIYWKFDQVLNNIKVILKSDVDMVDTVEFRYHGE